MSPQRFGRYEIKGEIGRGGMATVFHAYDPRFERDVAIKVLPQVFLHDPQFRARFDREAKTIALLEHPAIVPVYDFGEEDGQPYIVMRYMSGGSLSDRLAKGPIPVEEAVQIIARLAPALDVAHARGVIHRDLKPGNILFDQYGNAFLSDFGIARLVTESSAATLTGGAIVGTPGYMSPEQVQGSKDLDGRSDIYSLCVILFQMLTGTMPYQADTPASLMLKHILEPVPNILEVNKNLPPAFEEVVERAMAKEPTQRFTSAGEMARAIETACKECPPEPQPTSQATLSQATRIAHGPLAKQTVNAGVAPNRTASPPQRMIARPQAQAGAIPAASAASLGETAAGKKKGFPAWVVILGAMALIGVVGAAAFGLLFIIPQLTGSGRLPAPTAADPTLPLAAVVTTDTATPAPSPSPLPEDTDTPEPSATVEPTATSQPSETPAPSPTLTLAPVVITLGGADKLALLRENDIWTVNLDGSDLQQITHDGADKYQLQWTPDGQAIAFLTGKCIRMVWVEDGRIDDIACFESAEHLDEFEISPDGRLAAISLDYELYIVRFDPEQLRNIRSRNQLKDLAPCAEHTPYRDNIYKTASWSKDGQLLAIVYGAPVSGKRMDTIRILDVSKCAPKFRGLDNFPMNRFTMSGYHENPTITSFGWDGELLFALNSFIRNDGFGDLYIYNARLYKLQSPNPEYAYINPIEGACCYRDPRFSPDGRYLLFAFQDVRQAEQYETLIYYIPYGTIGTGTSYEPIPLPEYFLSERNEKPWLALRAAK